MAAANGNLVIVGLSSGQTYSPSCYLPDVANDLVLFSNAGKAGVSSSPKLVFSEPVALISLAILTGSAQTHLMILKNGQSTGDILLQALYLSSVVARPNHNILFAAGEEIGIQELA